MQGKEPKEEVSAWQSELGDCPLKCPWISLVSPADILCWKKEMPQLS